MNQWKLLKAFKFFTANGNIVAGKIDDVVLLRGDVFTLNGNRIQVSHQLFIRNTTIFEPVDVYIVTSLVKNTETKKITLTFNTLPDVPNAKLKQAITDLVNRI